MLLGHWGLLEPEDADADDPAAVFAADSIGPEILGLVQRKQRLLKDAWLTATGHDRPGMKAGLPLDEAGRQAQTLDERIDALRPPSL